jgi:hypothetical protein
VHAGTVVAGGKSDAPVEESDREKILDVEIWHVAVVDGIGAALPHADNHLFDIVRSKLVFAQQCEKSFDR